MGGLCFPSSLRVASASVAGPSFAFFGFSPPPSLIPCASLSPHVNGQSNPLVAAVQASPPALLGQAPGRCRAVFPLALAINHLPRLLPHRFIISKAPMKDRKVSAAAVLRGAASGAAAVAAWSTTSLRAFGHRSAMSARPPLKVRLPIWWVAEGPVAVVGTLLYMARGIYELQW